jgi:3',5'-cyclic AMP phosphodiesterase CpdA
MRILAIGDIHGKSIWKRAVSTIDADMIVFVGDYVIVNRWIFNRRIRHNLEDLIKFKRDNFDRVRLLLGNHDIAYLYPEMFPYSTLRKLFSPKLYRIYQENADIFAVAFEFKNYLFTHAGVSRGWFNQHRNVLMNHPGENLADRLNAINSSPHHFKILHEKGRPRGGEYPYGGVTYADKVETEKDAIAGYIQIVGHTKVHAPTRIHFEQGSIIYIDCLNSVNQFLFLHDDVITVRSTNGDEIKVLEDKKSEMS